MKDVSYIAGSQGAQMEASGRRTRGTYQAACLHQLWLFPVLRRLMQGEAQPQAYSLL
jgi:hypothetical protein